MSSRRRITIRYPGVRLLIAIVCSFALTGCSWSNFGRRKPQRRGPALFASDVTRIQLVNHLNNRASQLRSWYSNDISLMVKSPAAPIAIPMSGRLAVEQPRNFRLRANSTVGASADLGSNSEEVWFWVKGSDAVARVAHEDIPLVQRHGNLPFEPEWLMEVLGMRSYDTHRMQIVQNDGLSEYVDMAWEQISSNGQHFRRVITVDRHTGDVVAHKLVDRNANVLAEAKLDDFREVNGSRIPHSIVLDWYQQKTRMKMELGECDANQFLAASMWDMPHMKNCPTIDLGRRVATMLRDHGVPLPEQSDTMTTGRHSSGNRQMSEPYALDPSFDESRDYGVHENFDRTAREEPPWTRF